MLPFLHFAAATTLVGAIAPSHLAAACRAVAALPCNPVVVPAHAHPVVWAIAIVAMLCEVRVDLWMLRRLGRASPGLVAPLYVINITTWFAFLIAADLADDAHLPMGLAIAALEVGVVLVETVLIHSALRGRLFTRNLGLAPVTWPQALLVSFAGNVVSIAVSLAVPLTLLLSR